MEGQIEKSHKEYMEYDPNFWIGEFFDDDTGGYVVTHNNRIAQTLKSKRENNIVRNAKKAIDKQGAEVLMYQFDKDTERVHLELLKLKRKGYKVMYFFSEEKKVNIL